MNQTASKWILIVIALLGLGLSSCEWFKPARQSQSGPVAPPDDELDEIQGKRVFDPVTGTWRVVHVVTGKVDTVHWKVLPEETYKPIVTSTPLPSGTTTPSTPSTMPREVVLMLPFFANNLTGTTPDPNSLWAIQFYAGAKMAYDELASRGFRIHLTVFDTEGSEARVRELMRRPDLLKADLVIGPYKRSNVSLMADFVKKEKMPLVVPHTANYGMTEANPWYIQVNPSLKRHCEAIMRHARQRYKPADMLLVSLENEVNAGSFEYFQQANRKFATSPADTQRIREVKIPNDPSKFNQIDLKPYLRKGRPNVVLVPSWSSEAFVYSLLRHLMEFKTTGEEVIVYGMPQWMEYEQVDFEFFERLQVHVSSATYVNKGDERVRQFQRRYFDNYGTIPTDEAFLGYDIMRYFGEMVGQYGRDLSARIDAVPFDVLRGRFEFERVVYEPEKHLEDLNYFDQLENRFVHILRFQDYRFQPASMP
ncbi:MAG: hypothetical protein KatS3mg030_699 [Saprospiraceae bacterium]|nr:MAG: hypothetical protein KatS3mg030_699 [Saprospiraceae bacterium]